MPGRCSKILGLWTFLLLAAPLAAGADDAPPQPVRDRPAALLGLQIPDVLVILGHDVTIPLPALRLGAGVSRRLAFEITGATLTHDVTGRWTMIHGSASYFLWDDRLSPYFLGGAGVWRDRGESGDVRSYPFAFGGAGAQFAGYRGFVVWLEVGPAVASYTDGVRRQTTLAIYGGLGVGIRVPLTGRSGN
jgi:hypothetical protein